MAKSRHGKEKKGVTKEKILDHALALIIQEGYDGFSMRKLAVRLDIAAKTIYNYFHNQDELYLHLLMKGFGHLLDNCETAIKPYKNPSDQLSASIRAYVEFGIEHANIYNLLFTWHVPKAYDYIGTPMEETANEELEMALRCQQFFADRITACVGEGRRIDEKEIRYEVAMIWSQMHGYVAGINNTLLDYLYENPGSMKNRVIDRISRTIENEIARLGR